MKGIRKAIGSLSQAKKVLKDARQDTERPHKNELDAHRRKKQGGGN